MDPVQRSLLEVKETRKQRVLRYRRAWAFYRGSEYLGTDGELYIQDKKLFKAVKHLFGYVAQIVDTDTRFALKRKVQVDAEDRIRRVIERAWERSNFQSRKYKAMRDLALLGDAIIILEKRPDSEIVLRFANPEDIDLKRDPDDRDTILEARQDYVFFDQDGQFRVRTWLYFPDRVERYTDEKMDQGYPQPHPFGQVPVIPIQCIDAGEEWGLSSWHYLEEQLNGINELASFAMAILKVYADPLLVGRGMMNPPRLTKSVARAANYVGLGPDQSLEFLEYKGNALPHVADLLEKIALNVKEQVPELALAELRDQASLSGLAVNLKLADLIAKIDEIRGNFADALEWANALIARAELGRPTDSLENYPNHVRFEPILPQDVLEQLQAWETEQRLGIVSKRELLRRQGLSEEEISQRLQEIEDETGAEGYGLRRLAEEARNAAAGG